LVQAGKVADELSRERQFLNPYRFSIQNRFALHGLQFRDGLIECGGCVFQCLIDQIEVVLKTFEA
jgi:hypothetical protein